MKPASESLRADAQVNRDRILEVAHEVLTADPEASLNSIAKLARVGAGTLYRHFPNRSALVVELFRRDIQEMVELAESLGTAHPPLTALRLWFDRLAHYGRIKHSLAGALHAALNERVQGEAYGLMAGAIARLLERGQAAGVVRPEVSADDLLTLMGFLWRTPPGAEGEARTERLLGIVMDGLKPPAA